MSTPRKSANAAVSTPSIHLDCLEISPTDLQAMIDGEPLDLTLQEFRLLTLLVQESGRLVLKQEIAHWLWDESSAGYLHRLGVVMSRLRKKLAASGRYRIETVRKRGYRLERSD